jgi:large-conductance mechanosensitive channel
MVGLSLATSFTFFLIPLFRAETPELLARTAPDVRDVFIAIAGGLALIIAMSRRSKQTNTIAGVAIATALMPPLCTAGYGLATWNLAYFGGAMFLFTINTIFIALATFVIVKFLRFPMVKYINSAKRKRIAQFASVVAFVILAGSVFMFVNLFRQNQYKQSANLFIDALKSDGISIIDEKDENIDYKNKSLTIFVYGNKLSSSDINNWKNKLPKYGLDNTNLIIKQGTDDSDLRHEVKSLTELYARNQEIISSRDKSINEKEEKIKVLEAELNKYFESQIPFNQISKEAKVLFNGLAEIGYANYITTDFKKIDTISVFNTKWYDSIPNNKMQELQLKKWLKTRLELDTLLVTRNR